MNSVGFGDSNHKTIPYTRDGPVDKTFFCGGALRGGSNEGGGGGGPRRGQVSDQKRSSVCSLLVVVDDRPLTYCKLVHNKWKFCKRRWGTGGERDMWTTLIKTQFAHFFRYNKGLVSLAFNAGLSVCLSFLPQWRSKRKMRVELLAVVVMVKKRWWRRRYCKVY